MGEIQLKSSSKSNDIEVADLGKPDTMRYNVLTMVINEEYDRAVMTLKDFMNMDSPYPNFKLKIERYGLHCIDLVNAIRAKRNFPGLSALTRTKQQELKDKFKDHFRELRFTLKKIESGLEELRINDVKSTKLVIKSFWYALMVVFVTGFFLEVIRGLGYTTQVVLNDYLEKSLDYIFKNFLQH